MPKVRSAKGVMVDFDLIQIKNDIATAPPPQDVQARQDFIDKKFRRKLKKAGVDLTVPVEKEIATPAPETTEMIDDESDINLVDKTTEQQVIKQQARLDK